MTDWALFIELLGRNGLEDILFDTNNKTDI